MLDGKIVKTRLEKTAKLSAVCFGLIAFCWAIYTTPEKFARIYSAAVQEPFWFKDIFFGYFMGFIASFLACIGIYTVYTKAIFIIISDGSFKGFAGVTVLEVFWAVSAIWYVWNIRGWYTWIDIVLFFATIVIIAVAIYKIGVAAQRDG